MVSTCSRCGTVAGRDTDPDDEPLPLGWSLGTSARGVRPLCPACTRDHVRDIEAKLDEEWWG